MKRLAGALAVCLLLLPAVTSSASETPQKYLVRIDLERREDLSLLLENGINVVQDLGEFALARASISDMGFMSSAGFSVDVLDSDWGYLDHYIVSLDVCGDPSRMGQVVYKDRKIAVIRRAPVPLLTPLANDAKRLRHSPIRMRKKREPSLVAVPDTLPDPLIQEMVDSVSTDTILDYLRSLEGTGTRYSPMQGCSLAAEYIKSNFEAAGLTARLKPYGFPAMVYDVCCVSDSITWAVDELGAIYKSVDGGFSWEEKYRHSLPLLGIFFLDSLSGWSVGTDGVLHTTDGGDNWFVQANTGALELFRCFFVDSLRGWASGASPDTTPAVYRTTDGGYNWVYSDFPCYGEFLGISFVDTLRGWVTGADAETNTGIICNTTDGGVTWSQQFDSTNIISFGICFVDTMRGWAAGGDANTADPVLMATTDGGQNWSQQPTGGWFLTDVDFADSVNGWCVGFGTIRHSTNGGSTWLPQSVPAFELFIALDMLDTSHGVFGGSGGLIGATFNSGSNWFASTTGGEFLWFNVEAELPGVDIPEEIYIICGHHDDISEDPLNNAPGADDNASGVSCVLEAARILSDYQFHRTIRFVTFSGEEQGLLGSEAYASEAGSLGLNIMGVLNLDMIGYLDEASHDLEIYCDMPSQWMADTILQFSGAYVPGLVPYKEVDPSMNRSDHASFWDQGYSAVLHIERAFVSWNPYYHSTGDTVGTLDLPYVTEMVKLGVASIAELADPYVVGAEESHTREGRADRLSLLAHGNPFSGRVVLRILNPGPGEVSLKIYDSSGRLVKEFDPVKGSNRAVTWEGADGSGSPVPSGVYFARAEAGGQRTSKKLVLVK